LFVEDVVLVAQECSVASVSFDDEAVADYFDRQVDRALRPERFGRIWVHTHPGSSPEPSATDEETFWRVFGRTDWAVMLILARKTPSHHFDLASWVVAVYSIGVALGFAWWLLGLLGLVKIMRTTRAAPLPWAEQQGYIDRSPIDSYVTMYGRAPAEADLREFFQTTPPTVHQMILKLEEKGLISRVPGEARSIKLLLPRDEIPPLKRPERNR
jgi:proteasome lid subunit RPN8/RPN11